MRRFLGAVCIAALSATSIWAQPNAYKTLLDESKHKAVLTLEEMPASYKLFRIRTAGDAANPLSNPFMLFGMAGEMNGGAMGTMSMMTLMDACFFDGSTTQIGSYTYLVTYAIGLDTLLAGEDQADSGQPRPKPSARLNLIREDAIQSISPLFDWNRKTISEMIEKTHAQSSNSAQERALAQAALALMSYANDADDLYPNVPDMETLQALLVPYVQDPTVLEMVGRAQMNPSLKGVHTASIENSADVPLLYFSTDPTSSTWIVAFADGHVASVDLQTWTTKYADALRFKLEKAPVLPHRDYARPTTAPDAPNPY